MLILHRERYSYSFEVVMFVRTDTYQSSTRDRANGCVSGANTRTKGSPHGSE